MIRYVSNNNIYLTVKDRNFIVYLLEDELESYLDIIDPNIQQKGMINYLTGLIDKLKNEDFERLFDDS